MAVQLVGFTEGMHSGQVPIPPHQPGDLILVYGSRTVPGGVSSVNMPSKYTLINNTDGSSVRYATAGYFFASSNSEESGLWTTGNAAILPSLAAAVFRGAGGIGASMVRLTAPNQNYKIPPITLTQPESYLYISFLDGPAGSNDTHYLTALSKYGSFSRVPASSSPMMYVPNAPLSVTSLSEEDVANTTAYVSGAHAFIEILDGGITPPTELNGVMVKKNNIWVPKSSSNGLLKVYRNNAWSEVNNQI